jgi:phosphoribosylglycinamide formyltransferase-1
MRLGIVLSAGGAAFEEVARITCAHAGFMVVTNRQCGAESVADRLGIPKVRVEAKSRETMSKDIAQALKANGAHQCLLYFDRLVSSDLFESIPTFNVHPSALPSFAGIDGIGSARRAGARMIGCTLHRVDNTIDGGPIVSQISRGADPEWPIEKWNKIVFLMKVYCGLVWVAKCINMEIEVTPINASHGLPKRWMKSFCELQRREGEAAIS